MTNYQKMPTPPSDKLATEMTNLTSSNSISNRINSNDQCEFDLPIEKDIPITQDITINNEFIKPKKKIIPMKATRKGNMIMMCYNKNGEPLIVIGPHWPFTLCMICFINLSNLFCYYFFFDSLPDPIKIMGIIIFLLQSLSYLIIFIMNPGIPPKELWIENYFKNRSNQNEIGSYKICNICKIIMRTNDNTKHCEECNMCIMGLEYHCSWISKCVSKKNKKIYYVFLVSTFTLAVYYIIALLIVFFIKAKSISF